MLTISGLSLDIVGVVILFIASSTKRIEAEISYRSMKVFMQEAVEWEWSESLETARRSLPRLKRSVQRNRRALRLGLVMIVIGFVLQLIPHFFEIEMTTFAPNFHSA